MTTATAPATAPAAPPDAPAAQPDAPATRPDPYAAKRREVALLEQVKFYEAQVNYLSDALVEARLQSTVLHETAERLAQRLHALELAFAAIRDEAAETAKAADDGTPEADPDPAHDAT